MSAQRWADGINMWPNAVGTFNCPLGMQIVCLGLGWIHRNVDKKIFKKIHLLTWGLDKVLGFTECPKAFLICNQHKCVS